MLHVECCPLLWGAVIRFCRGISDLNDLTRQHFCQRRGMMLLSYAETGDDSGRRADVSVPQLIKQSESHLRLLLLIDCKTNHNLHVLLSSSPPFAALVSPLLPSYPGPMSSLFPLVSCSPPSFPSLLFSCLTRVTYMFNRKSAGQ